MSESKSAELLPCPFCGGVAVIGPADITVPETRFCIAYCKHCKASIHGTFDRDGATAWWNRRATSAAVVADLTETAKRIAWEHHKVTHPASNIASDADGYWQRRGGAERAAWLAAARAAAPPPSPNDAMREALEGMVRMYVALVDSGDAGFWDPEEVPEVKAARAALSRPAGEGASATVPAARPDEAPVRCRECGWVGDATDLGHEGECGGDCCPGSAVVPITEPADQIRAWLDSEGTMCGKALADAGLIKPRPCTADEAKNLDLEPGDAVWEPTAKGEAELGAAPPALPTAEG